ncbi:MAG: leucyl aminopeptidase family protein [Megasphaera sp.]|jgi:leucyl aminopeptidase|nr:leucyl aminopeptidase family protein [Megasphaera sp.]MCH4218393.1 leucyl aminopeptidase family protein [Megasphaera sp.]
MITCNSNGSLDTMAVGIDKRMLVMSRIPREDAKVIQAYVEKHPAAMNYTALRTFHCFSEGRLKTYFLIGLDDKPIRYGTYEDFLMAQRLVAAAVAEGVSELAVMVDTLEMDLPSLVDGLLYRNYDFTYYKTHSKTKTIRNINLITSSRDIKEYNTLCYVYSAVYEGIYAARDLVNMPSNDLTPRKLADNVASMIKGDQITIESINKWNLERRKMGGITAVGKGSMNPPQLVTIAYQGDPDSHDVLGIVGKGVTYDSGGLSLKSHANLEFMKSDMAGAATAIGVIRALMLLKYPVNVLAVLPLVENIPSSMSYRVDDIITMYGGKTVEIKNTDAEGRLILADAVTYAQEKGATRLIDLATLTGACVTALGTVRSGMLGNDQEWMNRFFEISGNVHEKVWQLPTDKEYEEQLHSDIADMKNTGGSDAGAITAGLFVKQFVKPNVPWIHLDIAGTAFNEKKDKTGFFGATGVGIKSILELLRGGQQ